MITTALISLTIWSALAVVGCLALHRARLAATPVPPPPPDPDATADDCDEDVARITELPPVPLPAVWDDFDEVMYRWFAEGAK